MSLLRVQQVEHGYRSGGLLGRGKWLQVLEGIDVQFEAGQTTGLLGSSGSGSLAGRAGCAVNPHHCYF